MQNSSFEQKISQYEPVDESLSSTDLQRGYWFVTHKVLLRNFAIALFLVFDILLFGYAVSGFISYFITGLPREEAMVVALARRLQTPTVEKIASSAPQPLVFGDGASYVFDAGDGRYDFVTEVTNPNPNWYVLLTFQYEVDGGEPTALKTVYLLPNERKFLTILGENRPDALVTDATLKIVNEMWSRVDQRNYPDPQQFILDHGTFDVADAQFIPQGSITLDGISDESGNKITFSIFNRTPYNFWSVPVQIALYRGGVLEGVEETEISEFRTEQVRAVELRNFSQNQFIDEVQVLPSVDVFDEGVYMNQ